MYKEAELGKNFCRRDRRNHYDPFAVATCTGSNVIGHMPRKISAICYVFLRKQEHLIHYTLALHILIAFNAFYLSSICLREIQHIYRVFISLKAMECDNRFVVSIIGIIIIPLMIV